MKGNKAYDHANAPPLKVYLTTPEGISLEQFGEEFYTGKKDPVFTVWRW